MPFGTTNLSALQQLKETDCTPVVVGEVETVDVCIVVKDDEGLKVEKVVENKDNDELGTLVRIVVGYTVDSAVGLKDGSNVILIVGVLDDSTEKTTVGMFVGTTVAIIDSDELGTLVGITVG